ncbi:hypothetical protein [Thiocystis violacea]|uniref:hypothetical protein n=1 Tax=Thiocystis violacea TaxID=13725 RepID=UPI001905FE5A|nr:hypothetical protein [Thiocystis violacea]MBK1724605.1 hypothetical protein [Thiocystis violacea]
MLQMTERASPGGAEVGGEDVAPAVCRIKALGFDPRMQNAMELLFKSRLNGRFVFAETDEADLHLIDLDSYGGRDLWIKQAEASPKQPMILLGMREVDVKGNTHFVRKPLKPQELIAALTAVADAISGGSTGAASAPHSADGTPAQMPSASTPDAESAPPSRPTPVSIKPRTPSEDADEGTAPATARRSVGQRLAEHDAKTFIGLAPDIDPKDAEQVAKTQFEPDAYLIGRLRQALKLAASNGRAVRLELEHGSITLVPGTGQAVIDLQHFQLRTLAVVPLTEENSRLRFVAPAELAEAPRHRIWPLESLLWNAALLASRGRVPLGTDLTAKVRLKRWPNLTRLAVFPSAVRITAFLSRDPVSLIDAARILKIPQRCVFAFFTAADALGLMEEVSTAQTAGKGRKLDLHPAPERPAKPGLLHRILSHLRR